MSTTKQFQFEPKLERGYKGMFASDRKGKDRVLGEVFQYIRDEVQSQSKSTGPPQTFFDPGSPPLPSVPLERKPPTLPFFVKPSKHQKQRQVFRFWPRNPNGDIIRVMSAGKHTPSGLAWGATLYDFYRTNRFPSLKGSYETRTTGSRLAAWMREQGELEWAEDELKWADMEEDPKLKVPYGVAEVIEELEKCSYSSACLPAPFPYLAPKLQSRIPDYLLPETLIVHDPHDVLRAEADPDNMSSSSEASESPSEDAKHVEADEDRKSTPDVHRTHRLHLRRKAGTMVEAERLAALELANAQRKKARCMILVDVPSSLQSGPSSTFSEALDSTGWAQESYLVPPALSVLLPTEPLPPFHTPEAHVYLSRTETLGKGNHSFVYNAEWELPREVLVKPKLCTECVREGVRKVLQREEEDMDVDREREVGEDGDVMVETVGIDSSGVGTYEYDAGAEFKVKPVPESTSGPCREPISSDNLSSTSSVDMPESRMGIVTIEAKVVRPGIDMSLVKESDLKPGSNPPSVGINYSDAQISHKTTYSGPIRTIAVPDLHWQTSGSLRCAHLQPLQRTSTSDRIPLTAKVRVAAKISIQHDDHLSQEAENYHAMPEHLFEHWTGFIGVEPISDPVPAGAVVPQFYGYYVPDEDEEGRGEYLSPLLLLEDCGSPIDPDDLELDDREECASLFFRFHQAGWAHGSVAPRNIVMQLGDVADSPLARRSEDKRFRLIDFGRSKVESAPNRAVEEAAVLRVLMVQHYDMFWHRD